MEFTQITTDEKVVIPAQEEKVFDKLYIKNIRFITKEVGNTTVIGSLVPFDGTEILDNPIKTITIDNIFTAMQDEERPEELRTLMAQTMEMLLQTIKAEIDYQKAKEDEQENEQETE